MSEINPVLEVGDRVVLIYMDDPYDAVKPGTAGTVVEIEKVPWGETGYQYRLAWDNGRNFAMDPELDSWVFKKDYDQRKSKKITESFETYQEIYRNFFNPNKTI